METIKEEKKADLEQLLNSLIEKGWEPRNIECKSVKSTDHCLEFYTELQTVGWIMKNERELVSKESGLWQFVCENGMVKMKEGYYWQNIALIHSEEYDYCDYQYWLIESALKDESELKDFLLQNIKIEGGGQRHS